jgi:hypothetical protein
MSDNFKYYGFYGRRGNTDDINHRPGRQKTSSNPQLNNKEFGVYVHNLFEEIPEHLEKEYSKSGDFGKNYGQVKNLTFVPDDKLSDEEKDEVQKLIDIHYLYLTDNKGDKISWAKMHAFVREYIYSGYGSKLSEEIVNNYVKIAIEELELKKHEDDKIIQQELEKQTLRTCDNIHIIATNKEHNKDNYNKIILEDYILKDDEKQFILGEFSYIDIYNNNPRTFRDPFIFRDSQMGFLSWNPMINKATVKCVFDNNTALFPIQIVLSNNPNYLLYDFIDYKTKKYIGYFIVRINYDEQIPQTNNTEDCKRLYNFKNDRGADSLQQYFVIFVFRNKNSDEKSLITEKYILTDFRFQRIYWGNVTRSKKVLFIEIQQLMCSLLEREAKQAVTMGETKQVEFSNNKKAYFYLISEFTEGINEPIDKICRSQEEEINILKMELEENKISKEINILNIKIEQTGELQEINDEISTKKQELDKLTEQKKKINVSYAEKKENKKCNEAWLDNETIEKLDRLKIKLVGETYNIFVAKIELRELYNELVKRNGKDNLVLNRNNFIIINDNDKKKYILLPCHFKWSVINKENPTDDTKYGNKKTFVIKHGKLDLDTRDLLKTHRDYYDSINYYKEELCVVGDCILDRDYILNTINNIYLFNKNIGKLPKDYLEKIKNANDKFNIKINEQQLLPQSGGGSNTIMKIDKLIKNIKLYKYNLKNIILSNASFYLKNIKSYNNIGLYIYDLILDKKQVHASIDKYINFNLNNFIPLIKYIIEGNILIISNNINLLLLCDKYLNIEYDNIILLLINVNINNLKILQSSKFKTKNKVQIYYFGNILNNELINNIIKYFNNTKFSNIIIDIVNNNQVFYSIMGLQLCKNLLLNFGSFVQFSKIPDLKDNLIYLYYLIFKCFKYNTFENYTAFIFKDSMYSLIYHTQYEYNLNDDEENIINDLLSNDITQKTNLLKNITLDIFDKLFIDYIYIKYLTIYYNLQNTAEKIFKTTYKLIEEKINEQQGGYQTSNITKLDLYDSKYTCTFLEKQLFLLHLNCLTKVYLHENKNLDNFYIYYDILPADNNDNYGYYQEILKNMFEKITWTNKYDKSKECIFISNNLDMYHKIKPKYALIDFKPDTDNNFFDGEILYTLYPFSNTDFKILVKEYNKIKKYSVNIFQELLDNNKFVSLCYNNNLYNINKVIPIKYLKLIPGYTDNIECILEYKTLYNYFYHLHDITDHNIIINKLFDITIDNENNMKYWLTCTLKKFQNAIKEIDIMFKNIIQLNIEQHAKHQIQLLNEYGSEVLNKQKINKAIKILEKYASDKIYIQIL